MRWSLQSPTGVALTSLYSVQCTLCCCSRRAISCSSVPFTLTLSCAVCARILDVLGGHSSLLLVGFGPSSTPLFPYPRVARPCYCNPGIHSIASHAKESCP